jgi:hypothetical protein
MRSFILFIGILVMCAVAHAATYEWTDNHGGLHFTDNLDKVPAKYLNKVRKVDVQPVIQEREQASQPAQQSIAPAGQNIFGGHDGMWWRSSFKGLRDEMKQLQDGLPGKKEKLAELRRKYFIFSKPGTRTASNDLDAEIANNEARISDLQKQLADLDDAATRAGVPQEWRK